LWCLVILFRIWTVALSQCRRRYVLVFNLRSSLEIYRYGFSAPNLQISYSSIINRMLRHEESTRDYLHWDKNNQISDQFYTISLFKIVTQLVYGYSHLYFIQPSLFQVIWDFQYRTCYTTYNWFCFQKMIVFKLGIIVFNYSIIYTILLFNCYINVFKYKSLNIQFNFYKNRFYIHIINPLILKL
jgi:hypothetical protein